MTVIYELSQYVDIARVVNDSEYASEKHLTVKEQNAVEKDLDKNETVISQKNSEG